MTIRDSLNDLEDATGVDIWRPSMRWLSTKLDVHPSVFMSNKGPPPHYVDYYTPDLADSPTRAQLLEIIREVSKDPTAHVRYMGNGEYTSCGDGWYIWINSSVFYGGATEADAVARGVCQLAAELRRPL
jgi:hypothetical protein